VRLLTARAQTDAVRLLNKLPWRLYQGDNYFHDEFLVLYAYLATDAYVDAGGLPKNAKARAAAKILADAIEEIGVGFVRFVGFGIEQEEEQLGVPAPEPSVTSTAVRRAVQDARTLLESGAGATSAVDRVHTALHGYLTERCRRLGLVVAKTGPRDSMASLFKKLRKAHPAFTNVPHADDIAVIAQSLASAMDRMDKLRNNASVAHPNEDLLDEPEARLAVDSVWAILSYLDARMSPLD
jgi:hypothetical protein